MTKPGAARALKVLEPKIESDPGARAPADPAVALVGLCLAAEHPTLPGRARICWRRADGTTEDAWLPQLQGVRAREGDRVLLSAPGNHDEQIVVGVLDGVAGPPVAPPSEHGPVLRLAEDEALRIAGPDGQPILEVKPTAAGPEVRLFAPPAALTFPGSFRVSADQIELEARKGEVRIEAAGDVKVTGEIIRLN